MELSVVSAVGGVSPASTERRSCQLSLELHSAPRRVSHSQPQSVWCGWGELGGGGGGGGGGGERTRHQ